VSAKSIRYSLQQAIPDMPPGRIIHNAESLEVEHNDGRARLWTDSTRQTLLQSLAEERALGKSGQLIEVRQMMYCMLSLEVLQGERDVGGELLQ